MRDINHIYYYYSVSSPCIHRLLIGSTPFLFLVVPFIEITSLHALHDLNEDVSVSFGHEFANSLRLLRLYGFFLKIITNFS